MSRATTDELLRVLRTPKFRLSPRDVEELLGDYLPWAEAVDVSEGVKEGVSEGAADLVCADADDQTFLDLAVAGSADGFVTGDGHLLAVIGRRAVRRRDALDVHAWRAGILTLRGSGDRSGEPVPVSWLYSTVAV